MTAFKDSFFGGIAGTIANSGLGLLLQKHNDKRQLEQQQKLGQQQLGLNIQQMAAQKAMDLQMWKDTNYSAQVSELEKAGLNPSLLYSKGGGGGTTIGSSGGNVSSAQAPQGGGEIMGLMMQKAQLDLMKAQTQATEAQANKANVEAAKTAGVDTQLAQTNIASLTQGIENQKADARLKNLESRIKDLQGDLLSETLPEQIASIGLEMQNSAKQLEILTRNSWIDENTKENKIKIVQQELFNMITNNALMKAQKAGINQNIAESKAKIQQAWQNISQGWKQLTINQGNLDVNDKNALTNELRLRFDKEIKDVSQSTQMTVETVTDILMSLLGSGNQRVRVKGFGN